MLNTIIACFLCVSVLPEPALPDLFKESVEKDDRYEVNLVTEEHQLLKDGLRFIVEIENKTTETIQLKVPRQNPPFRVIIYGEKFSASRGMDGESGAYSSPRTIILEGNSKVQFDPIVIKEYEEGDKKYNLESGRHIIVGQLVFIDNSENKIQTTRHRIGPKIVDME